MRRKVFDDYDYERVYDQSFNELTGELLNEVCETVKGSGLYNRNDQSGKSVRSRKFILPLNKRFQR